MKYIDTRGLSCPQPVVLVLQEIKRGKFDFVVYLDSEVALENVTRLLKMNNLLSTVTKEKDEYILTVHREKGSKKNKREE